VIPASAAEVLRAWFESQGWAVRRRGDSQAGAPPDDLVVTAPDGTVHLIALRDGDGPLHFGTVAWLEHSARRLAGQEGADVAAVLVTSQAVSGRVREIADDAGVRVVVAAGSTRQAAESVLRLLQGERRPGASGGQDGGLSCPG
jgi:hypothetical protein